MNILKRAVGQGMYEITPAEAETLPRMSGSLGRKLPAIVVHDSHV